MGDEEDQRQAAHDHKDPTDKLFVLFFHSKVEGGQFHPEEEGPDHAHQYDDFYNDHDWP
jgi:hypothetical protein